MMFRPEQILSLALMLSILCCLVAGTSEDSKAEGSTLAHDFAQLNAIFELIDLAADHRDLLFAKDANGWTPLHKGARNGNVLVVSFLVENGADANAKTNSGETPRDLINNEDALDEEGTSIRERYNLVQTILMWAEGGQSFDGHTIKKKKPTDELITHFNTLPHALVQLQLLDTLKDYFYLNHDLVHEYDANGWTPLHEAARNGNIEIIEFLVQHGAKITETTVDSKRLTPLEIAVKFSEEVGTTKHIDLIKKLIEEERNKETISGEIVEPEL